MNKYFPQSTPTFWWNKHHLNKQQVINISKNLWQETDLNLAVSPHPEAAT